MPSRALINPEITKRWWRFPRPENLSDGRECPQFRNFIISRIILGLRSKVFWIWNFSKIVLNLNISRLFFFNKKIPLFQLTRWHGSLTNFNQALKTVQVSRANESSTPSLTSQYKSMSVEDNFSYYLIKSPTYVYVRERLPTRARNNVSLLKNQEYQTRNIGRKVHVVFQNESDRARENKRKYRILSSILTFPCYQRFALPKLHS